MHWGYRDAIMEFKELILIYDLIEIYINRVSHKEDDKYYILEGEAQGIKKMMDVYKKRQELVFKLLALGN